MSVTTPVLPISLCNYAIVTELAVIALWNNLPSDLCNCHPTMLSRSGWTQFFFVSYFVMFSSFRIWWVYCLFLCGSLGKFAGPGSRPVSFIKNICANCFWVGSCSPKHLADQQSTKNEYYQSHWLIDSVLLSAHTNNYLIKLIREV